jgi:hypothetical protein
MKECKSICADCELNTGGYCIGLTGNDGHTTWNTPLSHEMVDSYPELLESAQVPKVREDCNGFQLKNDFRPL